MKKITLLLLVFIILFACRNATIPDVSGIPVNLQVQRFEKDFFAVDSNNLLPSMQGLQHKYPLFLQAFIENILELPRDIDTSKIAQSAIRSFLSVYRPINDSAQKKFALMDDIEKQVRHGLQFVKYYFPSYPLPQKLITFIGPVEGYGNVITADGFAVGLQSYMGKDFFLYNTDIGQATYPPYLSRRFSPEYISVNCMKNIINDIYPEGARSKPLVEQMVEKGKRLYVLDKILPYTPDSLKIGYTNFQLQGCYKNEGLIWNHFLTRGLLNSIDADILKYYLDEGPGTPEVGEGAPGYIGLFTGWQIVKRYMQENPSVSLNALLKTDARKIFEESKYRPK